MAAESNRVVDAPDIRRLIWCYFFLLMFEGALRKWILPGLSNPLLLVRDPFLLLIYFLAFSRGIFPLNGYVITLFSIGVVAALLGMTVGSGDLIVTVYGFDSLFFHLPLVFVMPIVMNRNDVVAIGRWVLVIALPMAVLMVIQFRSDPNAWINCGAGGGEGAQIRGALGRIRPPGLFTFITGAAQFLALATVFMIYALWKKGTYPRLLFMAAGFSVAIAAVVSTSRFALGSIGLVFVMIAVVVFLDRKSMNNVLGMLIPIGLIMVVATNMDVFKEGKMVFEARFEEAGDAGAGVVGTAANWSERVFGEFFGGYHALANAPLLGAGLGVGTNVGARVLSGGFGFLLAEGEWARVVLELGPFLAIPYLLIRVLICGTMFATAARSAREGNALPMLLFGASALLMLTGQFSIATTLGFSVFGSGLCLAAANVPKSKDGEEDKIVEEVEVPALKKRRGRSSYAEALHAGKPTISGELPG